MSCTRLTGVVSLLGFGGLSPKLVGSHQQAYLLSFWLVGVRRACFGPLGAAGDTELNKTRPQSWRDLEKKGVSEHFALL